MRSTWRNRQSRRYKEQTIGTRLHTWSNFPFVFFSYSEQRRRRATDDDRFVPEHFLTGAIPDGLPPVVKETFSSNGSEVGDEDLVQT